jgi:hypothetical protein
MHSYPQIEFRDDNTLAVRDGSLFKVHDICDCTRKKCVQFYQENEDKQGPMMCPYGFSSYFLKDDYGNRIVFTSLRITDFFERKKTKQRFSLFSPIISREIFELYLEQSARHTPKSPDNCDKAGDDIKIQANAIHEIRRINRELKYRAEMLKNSVDNTSSFDAVKRGISDIFWLSSLISTRLNFFDYEINPTIPLTNQKNVKVYQKFDKIRYCLNSLFRGKNIDINFRHSCYDEILAYDIFELLPFIIFENCYKYSPPSSKIDVFFEKNCNTLTICVKSLGPMLLETEKSKVFELGFRGSNSLNISPGTGTGLFFAKRICELNNILISISQGEPETVIEGVEYGQFAVILEMSII